MTLRSVASVALLVVLSACSSPQPYTGANYNQVTPKLLTVSQILVDDVTTVQPAPSVESKLAPTAGEMVRAMLGAHYQPVRPGVIGSPTIQFSIVEASIQETALPQPDGFFARMTSDAPEFRYDGRVVVEAKASGAGAGQTQNIHTEATRSLDVRGLDADARVRQVQGLVAQMVDDIAQQMDERLAESMPGHLISGESQSIYPVPSGRWDKVNEWK